MLLMLMPRELAPLSTCSLPSKCSVGAIVSGDDDDPSSAVSSSFASASPLRVALSVERRRSEEYDELTYASSAARPGEAIAYHNARAAWYKHRTGRTLTGTTAQMERQYDNACRFLRARTEELCRVCHLEVREEGEKHKMCRECWDKKSKEWPPGVAAMIVNQCN